ncbi:MAG: T9SS type A sorting domain-containing protein [Saprospiraceae bacterium]|nr:T9SS type A sorting domain-containing protein [Saprospiraceae bacterium]
MKLRFLLLNVALILCSSIASSQFWKLKHSFSPQQTLHKIRFQNSNYGLAVGTLYNGSTKNIHRTIDGGNTWQDVSSGYTGTRFMDIFFLNDSVVYMSGNEGLIIRSYDGGLSWNTLNTGTKEQLWSVYFTSGKIGYACGSNGVILYTINGGNDWENVSPGKPNLLYDITFTNSGTGFASGSNILWRTDDGGNSWQEVIDFPFERPADWIRSIMFVNKDLGFACADIGRIYRTKDGGNNWERLNSPIQDPLFEVDFIDEKNGFITGFNGTILRTIDGGESWEIQKSPLGTEHNYSIDFVDKDHAYICTHFGSVLQMLPTVNSNNPSKENYIVHLGNNPVGDYLEVNLPSEGINEYEIVNMLGQVHLKGALNSTGIINTSELSSGNYLFHAINKKIGLNQSRIFIKL